MEMSISSLKSDAASVISAECEHRGLSVGTKTQTDMQSDVMRTTQQERNARFLSEYD